MLAIARRKPSHRLHFIDENGGGPGVRLRKRQRAKPIKVASLPPRPFTVAMMATEMPVAQAVFNYGLTKSIVRETFTIASDQTGKGAGRQLRTVNQYDDIDLRTVIRYAECVIKSFVDTRTAALFAGYVVRNLPNQIQRRAKAKLVAIDAAKQIDDLRIPLGNCLESLHGDRRGQHSIRMINGESVSCGARVQHGKSRSSTITRGDTMSIKREDLDTGRIDFTGVTSGRKLAPIHPGEILRNEFLKPMKISVYALAQVIKVPRSRVNDIVLGRRAMTTDTALRLARYFGVSPEFWINLQARYDLEMADRTLRRRIEREIAPRAA